MDLDNSLVQAQKDELKLWAVLADTLDKLIANQERQVAILKNELSKSQAKVIDYELNKRV